MSITTVFDEKMLKINVIQMGERESVLSLACSLTVSFIVTVSLICLNVLQTVTLGNLFSPIIWLKSLVCSLPLSVSIFLLVPMLSGKSDPCRTRLSMLSTLVKHPLQGITFASAGMLLHYLLPILNPTLEIDTLQNSKKVKQLINNI